MKFSIFSVELVEVETEKKSAYEKGNATKGFFNHFFIY